MKDSVGVFRVAGLCCLVRRVVCRIGVVAAAIVCATVLVGATIAKARSVSDIPVTFEDVSAELTSISHRKTQCAV